MYHTVNPDKLVFPFFYNNEPKIFVPDIFLYAEMLLDALEFPRY